MNKVVKEFIATREVEGSFLARLRDLEQEDSALAVKLLEALNPSANTLRELLRLADEISARDKVEIIEVFNNISISELLTSQLPRKRLQERIRKELEKLRYPETLEIEKELESCKKQLVKKYGLKLELPKDLEGDAVSLKLSAKSQDELISLGEKLQALGREDSAQKIFSILNGEC